MQGIYETVTDALQKALGENIQKVVEFLPNLISAILILFIGWIIAKIIGRLAVKIFQTMNVDTIAENRGITTILHDMGFVRAPSAILGRTIYLILLFLFLIPTFEALKLNYISQLFGQFLTYLPNLVAAGLIFIIGLAVAKIIAGSVAASAKGAGLEYAGAIGLFMRYFLNLVVLILGLSQLGVQTNILTIIFTVLIVSLGLALALALGLGSKSVVSNILAGAFAREHFSAGKEVEIQGVKGKIVTVGSVTTSIETDGREVTVPNTLLIENMIE